MTENGVAQVPPDEDRTPTQEEDVPAVPPPDPWVMPEPVFRKSDGYTPGGRWPLDNEATTAERDLDVSEDAAVSGGEPAAIAEQPEMADEAVDDQLKKVSYVPAKKKRGFFRLLLIILGIVAIALATAAVGTAIVIWYFFQVSESQNLN